jgi:hypothetical protein
MAKWLEDAARRSEADKKIAAALVKYKVVSHVLQPEDPCPNPERAERRQFEAFCRGAAEDCGPYVERLIELCVHGGLSLAPRDGSDASSAARAVLHELSGELPPVLEQMLVVGRDLASLGWGRPVIGQPAPAAQINSIRESFQLQAEQIGVLPHTWCEGKISSIQTALGTLEELLLTARTWYVRDRELFEAASLAADSQTVAQLDWLNVIRDRTAERIGRVDGVLSELQLRVKPALAKLACALKPEVVTGISSISV